MAVGRGACVLELDGPRLTAVAVFISGGEVTARARATAIRPEAVAADDPAAVGRWVGQVLSSAGLSRERVLLAIPRGDVVLKRLPFPEAAHADEAEVAGMVRLAMSRHLTMALEGSAIDWAPAPGQEGELSVMAAALPGDRLRWYRTLCEEGRLNLWRIGLRCYGVGRLAAGRSARCTGSLMAVAMGRRSCEFVVMEEGRLVFARAVEAPAPEAGAEADGFADRLAMEAGRTWTSHRVTTGVKDLETVVVLGEGELARLVADRCARQVSVPGEVIGAGDAVRWPGSWSPTDRTTSMALAGLAAGMVEGRCVPEFALERKPPDRHARARQFALAGMLGLILAGGGVYITARARLGGMADDLARARQQTKELDADYARFAVEHSRLTHTRKWLEQRPDWLGHLERIHGLLPEPSASQLDLWSGVADRPDVQFKASGEYPGGTWRASGGVSLAMEGKVKARQTAQDLRGRLVAVSEYTVKNRGPDAEGRFALELDGPAVLPKTEPAPAEPATPAAAPAPEGRAAERAEGSARPKSKGRATP